MENRLPGHSIPNTTPTIFAEAFADCVITMNDASPLITCLEEGVGQSPRRWLSCAAAAENIAFHRPMLMAPFRDRLHTLINRADIQQSDYLHYLIPVLGALDRDDDTEALLEYWADGQGASSVYAMEVLARWKRLARHERLLEKLGLE